MLGQAIETSPGQQEQEANLEQKITDLNKNLDEQKEISKLGLIVGIIGLVIKIFKN